MISKGDIKDLTLILIVIGVVVGISAGIEHMFYAWLIWTYL
tara:strand:+ start:335 stop:457 length:123 start_codon:yes stop_codon:yes gene_type:complete